MDILPLLSENSQPPIAIYFKHTGVEIKLGGMNLNKSSLPNRPTVFMEVLVNKNLFGDVDLISWVVWISLSHHVIQYDRLGVNGKKKDAIKAR